MSWKLQVYSLIGIALIGFICNYLIDDNIELRNENQSLTSQLSEQAALIINQQSRIQHLAELDKAHTQELANAKTEIDTLRADVAAGRRKLRIKATCPVPETTPPGSMGDGTAVELTREAGSTVLDIREDIINDRAKLSYLQGYIKTECRGKK
ncbi:lysis protein [Xenorhabdus sp. DI]|uniref:lysis protein n=1 Tax=Xenorhabdus doucetiae TaxID=351671 RepID=UPI0019BA2F06|nr:MULTISPECIES: lysis protein [unclassified Xenorhabdus]MBD2786308.1 lysis protein [Xenorhabdus sp. 3]MBD2789834.1 lysis protein [Xenorhabdus sp. DI]